MLKLRRYIEVLAFVAVWMAGGWLLHLDANVYLLLGVPLIAIFQLFVRRQPLQKLLVRDAASFRLCWIGIIVAGLLAVAPAYDLLVVALPKQLWIVALWLMCSVAGAIFAAFALVHQRASTARQGLPAFLAAVLIGTGLVSLSALAKHHPIVLPLPKLLSLLKQFLLYFDVCFMLEEVAFRGALDSHVFEPESNRKPNDRRWFSSIFVSALWGLWHLPTLPLTSAATFVVAISAVIVVHSLIGVPLSFCWRASGTLVLPAAAHALIDAFRNTMLQ